MTSKLKCPVCKQELFYTYQQDGIFPNPNKEKVDTVFCNNCKMYGNETVWQELIQTKKELEIAKGKIVETPVNTSDLWKHEQTHYGEPHLLELMDEWGVDGTNYADFRSVIQEHCLNKGLYAFADIEKVWKEHIKSLKKAVKSIKGDKND